MKIKNIVFDFGGVLLSEDDDWLSSRELKELLGKDFDNRFEAWKKAWPETQKGNTSEVDFFKSFLESATGSIEAESIEKLKFIYRKYVFKSEAYSVLEKLKGKYRLFALTNISRDWLNLKINLFNLNSYFELIISSSSEGIGKPNPEIYYSLIKKAGINPKESLFIDNFKENIIPAKKLGFNTILFVSFEQMKKDMIKMGIKI